MQQIANEAAAQENSSGVSVLAAPDISGVSNAMNKVAKAQVDYNELAFSTVPKSQSHGYLPTDSDGIYAEIQKYLTYGVDWKNYNSFFQMLFSAYHGLNDVITHMVVIPTSYTRTVVDEKYDFLDCSADVSVIIYLTSQKDGSQRVLEVKVNRRAYDDHSGGDSFMEIESFKVLKGREIAVTFKDIINEVIENDPSGLRSTSIARWVFQLEDTAAYNCQRAYDNYGMRVAQLELHEMQQERDIEKFMKYFGEATSGIEDDDYFD